jgi:hypothetical protein
MSETSSRFSRQDTFSHIQETIEEEDETREIGPIDYYAILNISRNVENINKGDGTRHQECLQTALYDISSR